MKTYIYIYIDIFIIYICIYIYLFIIYICIYIYIYIYIYVYGIPFELSFFDSLQKVGPSGIQVPNPMLTVHML